jgi:hypothetical protein
MDILGGDEENILILDCGECAQVYKYAENYRNLAPVKTVG